MEPLPTFRYHPDPIATGSIELSDAPCLCCGRSRGAMYVGPVYVEEVGAGGFCPWCIADGSAARRFNATFVDDTSFDSAWPIGVADELTRRTPGYVAWQDEVWRGCCRDACAFLGPFGLAEIRRDHYEWEGLLTMYVVHDMGISGGAATRLVESLDRDRGPTAYAFRCLHCGATRFHIDEA